MFPNRTPHKMCNYKQLLGFQIHPLYLCCGSLIGIFQTRAKLPCAILCWVQCTKYRFFCFLFFVYWGVNRMKTICTVERLLSIAWKWCLDKVHFQRNCESKSKHVGTILIKLQSMLLQRVLISNYTLCAKELCFSLHWPVKIIPTKTCSYRNDRHKRDLPIKSFLSTCYSLMR